MTSSWTVSTQGASFRPAGPGEETSRDNFNYAPSLSG